MLEGFDEFLAAWSEGIFHEAVLTAVIAGGLLGYLGVFIVMRRLVFITAAVSQASGFGVALAFYLGIHAGVEVNPVVGALIASLGCTYFVSRSPKLMARETLLGAAFLFFWAGSVLLGERIRQESHEIADILYGSAVFVDPIFVKFVAAAAAIVAVVHGLLFRGFVFAAFDPAAARVQGLPVRTLDFISWTVIGVAIALCARALGVLPTFAFAVLPAVAATLLVTRLRYLLLLATGLGCASGALGFLFAVITNSTVGASQAAAALAFCGIAWLVRILRSLLTRTRTPQTSR